MTVMEWLKEARKEDRFAQELEEAFRPRKDGDGTAFRFNRYTLVLVLFFGIAIASLALPLFLGNPVEPVQGDWVEGMASQIG